MKKLSLFLLVSVFAFCGCSDDDDAKTYVPLIPQHYYKIFFLST